MGCVSVKQDREGKSMSDLNNDDPFHNCDTVDSYVEVIHNSIIAGKKMFDMKYRPIVHGSKNQTDNKY